MKFCAGYFSLDNAAWSSRPAEVDRDQMCLLFLIKKPDEDFGQSNNIISLPHILK